jgi:DNA polymerase III delta prime subunit
MVRFNAWGLGTACLIIVAAAGPAVAADADTDKQAKEIYGQLFKAIKAKDLDGVMKLVDVPWFGLGKDVVKDEEEVKKRFKEFLDRIKDTSELKVDIKEVMSYAQFREKHKDKKDLLKLLDELKLTKEDRVLQVFQAAVLVRIRDGKAKVVGVIE